MYSIYKRLLLGINSAPEELQHVLQTLLADMGNTVNVVDHVIVFKKSDEEHDKCSNNKTFSRKQYYIKHSKT